MIGFEKPNVMPLFRVFTEENLNAIHLATLNVLAETGIRIVHSDEILKMLKEKGCRVNFEKKTVLFPPYLVEEALGKTTKIDTAYGRNSKYDFKLDGRHVYFTTDTETTSTVDLETGEWRPSSLTL